MMPVKRIQNAHKLFKIVKINVNQIKTVGNGVLSVLEINLPSMLLNVLLLTTVSAFNKNQNMDLKNVCQNLVQHIMMNA
jgi:hypothetical protein